MARLSLRDLIEKELGIKTEIRENPEITTVGVTASRIFRRNPDRVGIYVINHSTVAMFAGHFPDPSASKGIRLGASGGDLFVFWREDLHLPGEEWFIVADAAASALYNVEFLAV